MIIERKNPLFGRFGDFVIGTVIGDPLNDRYQEIYMKMQDVRINKDGHSEVICNAVNIGTGEWAFFNDDEEVVPYINARITLE